MPRTTHELKQAILAELEHGPFNMYELAAALEEPPFRIRGELRAMKRERLVKGIIGSDSYVWEITDAGRRTSREGLQTSLSFGSGWKVK